MKNYNLLEALYKIYAPSRGEKRIRKFVRKQAIKFGATRVVTDNCGNLLVTKGHSDTYPCIAAHLDQVQDRHSKDFAVIKHGDVILGFSEKQKEQQGLGADDKNGIWIALEMLEQFDVLKCAFFVGEEIGCVGSSDVNMDFFKDVRFVIQADRRNGSDLITDISGTLCSDEFLDDIHYHDFGYRETTGLMTDVETLCSRGVGVSCINFSCGYYSPHTDNETTSWKEICNARDFAANIIENCTKVYTHKYESAWKGYGRGRNYLYDDWDDYWNKKYNGYWKKGADGVSRWVSLDKDKQVTTVDKGVKQLELFKETTKEEDDNGVAEENEVYDGYDYSNYAVDFDTMVYLLEEYPELSFGEMLNLYSDFFYNQNADYLWSIYQDAWASICSAETLS